MNSTSISPLPQPPELSPEEDLRRTRLFLSALGLTGKYLDIYAGTLTLKEAINMAIVAANLLEDARANCFRPFVSIRLRQNRTPKYYVAVLNQLSNYPSLLGDKELQKLGDTVGSAVRRRNASFLDCESQALKTLEKYSLAPLYDRDPTLVFLKAAGINEPENMDNCGFIDAVYKLNQKGSALADASNHFLPLPLSLGSQA